MDIPRRSDTLKSLENLLCLVILVFVLLLLLFGDFCLMDHAQCCMLVESDPFNHNIPCHIEVTSDKKCNDLISTSHELGEMDLMILTNDKVHGMQIRTNQPFEVMMDDSHNTWIVKKSGSFSRYYLLSKRTNFTTSYGPTTNIDDHAFTKMLIFTNNDKSVIGLLSIQEHDLYILIK